MKHLKIFEGAKYPMILGKQGRELVNKESVSGESDREDFNVIKKILEKDCSQFLEDIKDSHLVFRGITSEGDPVVNKMYMKEPRKNRKPLSTDNDVQEFFDDVFEKIHGTRLRSKGVFTTKNIWQADGYGTTHIIFPIGDYKCFWFENVQDFYHEIKEWDSGAYYITRDDNIILQTYGEPPEELSEIEVEEWYSENQEELIGEFRECIEMLIEETGMEGKIDEVINEEMVFLCDSYYMVDISMVKFFWEWFDLEVSDLEGTELKHLSGFNESTFTTERGDIDIELFKRDSGRIYSYAATMEGKTIGSLSVYMQPIDMDIDRHENGYAFINDVHINENYRRLGIYTEMIKRATKDAQNHFGLKGIVSNQKFWSDRSDKANRFWEKTMKNQKELGLNIREIRGDFYVESLNSTNELKYIREFNDTGVSIKRIMLELIEEFEMTPEEINQGECYIFADNLEFKLSEIGIKSEILTNDLFFDIAVPEFRKDETIFYQESDYNTRPRPEGLDWEDDYHGWLYCNGKHYDAECLDGVVDFYDLPIFKRMIK